MMRDSKTVSAVITCYNYGHYLPQAIESVLSQTYRDVEVIVVNDGSTDTTEEVVERYSKGGRIIYLRQPNLGQAFAKNLGISSASGEYVAFLDADDAWEPVKLERQMALFADTRVSVVYSSAWVMDSSGRKLFIPRPRGFLRPRSGNVLNWLLFDNFLWFSSTVVRRHCFDDVGMFDTTYRMGIDWDLWLRMATRYRFDYIFEPLIRYRVGHGGQMSTQQILRLQEAHRIFKNFIRRHGRCVDKASARKAWSYLYENRGHAYREKKRRWARRCFVLALRSNPLNMAAAKGLLMTLAKRSTHAV